MTYNGWYAIKPYQSKPNQILCICLDFYGSKYDWSNIWLGQVDKKRRYLFNQEIVSFL